MPKQTIRQGPNRFAIRKIVSPGVNPYTALVEKVGAADAMRLSSWISRSIETAAKSGAINNIFFESDGIFYAFICDVGEYIERFVWYLPERDKSNHTEVRDLLWEIADQTLKAKQSA